MVTWQVMLGEVGSKVPTEFVPIYSYGPNFDTIPDPMEVHVPFLGVLLPSGGFGKTF